MPAAIAGAVLAGVASASASRTQLSNCSSSPPKKQSAASSSFSAVASAELRSGSVSSAARDLHRPLAAVAAAELVDLAPPRRSTRPRNAGCVGRQQREDLVDRGDALVEVTRRRRAPAPSARAARGGARRRRRAAAAARPRASARRPPGRRARRCPRPFASAAAIAASSPGCRRALDVVGAGGDRDRRPVERRGGPRVGREQPAGRRAVVDRVADDRVAEAEAPRHVGRAHEVALEQRVEAGQAPRRDRGRRPRRRGRGRSPRRSPRRPWTTRPRRLRASPTSRSIEAITAAGTSAHLADPAVRAADRGGAARSRGRSRPRARAARDRTGCRRSRGGASRDVRSSTRSPISSRASDSLSGAGSIRSKRRSAPASASGQVERAGVCPGGRARRSAACPAPRDGGPGARAARPTPRRPSGGRRGRAAADACAASPSSSERTAEWER